jgi:hypothetical protein
MSRSGRPWRWWPVDPRGSEWWPPWRSSRAPWRGAPCSADAEQWSLQSVRKIHRPRRALRPFGRGACRRWMTQKPTTRIGPHRFAPGIPAIRAHCVRTGSFASPPCGGFALDSCFNSRLRSVAPARNCRVDCSIASRVDRIRYVNAMSEVNLARVAETMCAIAYMSAGSDGNSAAKRTWYRFRYGADRA